MWNLIGASLNQSTNPGTEADEQVRARRMARIDAHSGMLLTAQRAATEDGTTPSCLLRE